MQTILCYGDSNTWGTATRAPASPREEPRYAPAERWPGVLQAALGAGWSVIAEGLSGRTTVHPDPFEGLWLDGSAHLLPCLKSHRPLDAVALLLGTNDLKQRFGVPAGDIAKGIGVLLATIAKSECGPERGAPKMLVICPPPILETFGTRPDFVETFAGGHAKSLKLAPAYRAIAAQYGAAFLDAGTVIRSSAFDGIHLDKEEHAKLGRAVADTITKLGW
jgi:lysophospholipase L1-like esterase